MVFRLLNIAFGNWYFVITFHVPFVDAVAVLNRCEEIDIHIFNSTSTSSVCAELDLFWMDKFILHVFRIACFDRSRSLRRSSFQYTYIFLRDNSTWVEWKVKFSYFSATVKQPFFHFIKEYFSYFIKRNMCLFIKLPFAIFEVKP